MKPDYGIDAPNVIRNLLISSACGILLALFVPRQLHVGPVILELRYMGWGVGFGAVPAAC